EWRREGGRRSRHVRRWVRRWAPDSRPDALRPPDFHDRAKARVIRRMRTEVRVDRGREAVQRVATERRDLRTGHLVAGTERRQLVRTDRYVQRRVGRSRGYVDVVRERGIRRDADVEAPERVREWR